RASGARRTTNSRARVERYPVLLLGSLLLLLTACGETPTTPSSASSPEPAFEVSDMARKEPGGNSLNAKACQKNGWQDLVMSTGDAFLSEEACVSYAAQGGTLYQGQTI